jgi:signal peptidase I
MVASHLKVLALALAAIVALFLQQGWAVKTVADEATLMEPAVRRRAVKIFKTDGAVPPRASVVWFEHAAFPGRMLLARAVGVPGDRVAIEQGRLVRDGRPLPEDYAEKRIELEDLEEIVVPDGYLYVLNDARSDPGSPGLDSRRLGPVPVASVVGYLVDRVAERESGAGAGASPGKGRR